MVYSLFFVLSSNILLISYKYIGNVRKDGKLIKRDIFYAGYIYKPSLMQDLAKYVADCTDTTHFCV